MDPSRNAAGLAGALGLRPLSARSVVASVLMASHPPELPTAVLVGLCDHFGIATGTIRVALSRMVAAGELASVPGGYRLAGPALLERQRAQDEARHPPAGRWDGRWWTAVVVASSRSASERADLRRAFAEARFAGWREGVWIRPTNLPRPAGSGLASDPCRWLVAEPEGDPALLAGELWYLDRWSHRAGELLAATDEDPGDLLAAPRPRTAAVFTAAAALLRHLRTDPLLPHELLPATWPGDELRSRYAAHVVSIEALIRQLASDRGSRRHPGGAEAS